MEITLSTTTESITIEHKSKVVAIAKAQEWLDVEKPGKTTVQIIEHKKYLGIADHHKILKAAFLPSEMKLAELLTRIDEKRFSPDMMEA